MTTAITTQSISASAFLFGDNQDSVDALARALDENGVVGSLGAALNNLSRAGRAAVGNQIATVAHGLLDLDLGDLVVGGWFKFADLTAAAKRSVAAPGSSQIVDLVTHCITSTHSPHVEVLVNDTRVATVRFELCITFTVKGVAATVRDGHLVALQTGTCDVAGTLAAEGRQLAKREAHLELPLLLHLGDGIPLLRGGGLIQPTAPPPSPEPEA
ncbi:MAG TPA: hypothetical protein VF933_35130 [Streptosporangiaceae bacterium]